jgi:K+/H+ antiporter YhaU regulatory subunit KhtT
MAKMWEQLTQEEKIEDLRRDVLRLFEFQDRVAHQVGQSLAKMLALTRRVSELEQRK